MAGKGILTNKVQLSSIIIHQPWCLVRSCILEPTSTWKSKNLWTSCHNNSSLSYLHSWVIFSSSKGIPETHIFAIRLRLTIQGFFPPYLLSFDNNLLLPSYKPRWREACERNVAYQTAQNFNTLSTRLSRLQLLGGLSLCLSVCLPACRSVSVCLPATR